MFVKNVTGIVFVIVLIRISNNILQVGTYISICLYYVQRIHVLYYITRKFESIFWFENLKSFNIENLNEKADENI